MDLKLTTKAQEAMAGAATRAVEAGHPQVEPLQLLAALLDQRGVATALLTAAGADPAPLAREAAARLGALPRVSGSSVGTPQLSRAALTALTTTLGVLRRIWAKTK